ncbi:hypothetical protein GCM10018966_073490 [Streptomyces yanii]
MAAVLLAGLLGGEVEVFDADRGDPDTHGPVDQLGQGVADLGVAVTGGPGQVEAEAARVSDGVAVPVEPVGGEVVGVGVDTDHAPGAGGLQRDGPDGGALPGRGEVPAAAAGVEVDAVGDGPVRFDAVGPLRTPVRERDAGGEDVPAVLGVGQVRDGGRQSDADLTVRGDADGLLPEPLPRLAVGSDEPALRLPPLPPLLLGEPGLGEVVAGVEQTSAAPHHPHASGLPVGDNGRMPRFQCREAAGLVEPLALGAVAARGPLRSTLADREGQPMPQHVDPGFQCLDVRCLATARERPLIVRGLGDRPRDPRRRQRRQVPLTRRPGVRTVLQTVRTASLEITRSQRTLMLTDRTQHHLVLGGEVPQPVTDRHPARPRHHEGRRQLPHTTHHTTPSLKGQTPAIQPNEQQPPRSPIRPQNPRSHAHKPTDRTHSRSPPLTSAQQTDSSSQPLVR